MRRMLNYGHTIGHGIKATERYRLRSGTCVGIGMLAIGRFAHRSPRASAPMTLQTVSPRS